MRDLLITSISPDEILLKLTPKDLFLILYV